MKKHKHIPSLKPLELEAALARLEVSKLSQRGKQLIRQMLQAASNPNSEAPEVVIQTLETERQQNIQQLQLEISQTFASVHQRGREGLQAITDAEWEQLISATEG